MSAIYQAGSYLLLAPAYYVGSSIKYALGYSIPSSADTETSSSTDTISLTYGMVLGAQETRTGDSFREEEDEREVRICRALKEAMRNYASDSEEEETGPQESFRGAETESEGREEPLVRESEHDETKELILPTTSPEPFSPPLEPPSDSEKESEPGTSLSIDSVPPVEPVEISTSLPPTTDLDSLTSSQSIPAPQLTCDRLSTGSLRRCSYDLSTTLSRLSRRATVCLTTLDSFENAQNLPTSTPTSDDNLNVQVDLERKEEVVVREKELELIETILGEELKAVEAEVEEFVERVIKDEQRTILEAPPTGEQTGPETERAEEEENGWTWFRDQAQYKDFNEVQWTAREGTNAEDFCQACEGLIRLAEHLAPALAGLATKDIGIEIKKIRTRTKLEKVSTLEQIITLERNQRRKIATEAINWLLLILNFGARAYQINLASIEKEELSVSFTKVWDREYYKYFNFIVRPLFKILIKACPSRETFYSKLGLPTELVESDFRSWLQGVELVIDRIEEWQTQHKKRNENKA